MRIICFVIVLLCGFAKAQDGNKTALTAGGEFSKNNESSQSITSNQTTVIVESNYRNEVPELTTAKNQNTPTKPGKINFWVYILVFLIAAIVFFLITRKNKANLAKSIDLENEDDEKRKKELWDALGEAEHDEQV